MNITANANNSRSTEKVLAGNLSHNATKNEIIWGDVYVENYSLVIKICFAIFGIVVLMTNFVACLALNRTKRIPHAPKFLAIGLLSFDLGFILFSTIRKFMLNPTVNTTLMVAGTVNLQLSYVTIGLMSLERYLVFSWPNKYLRYCTIRFVRVCTITIWTTCICIFLILRYGICYVQNKSMFLVAVQAGTCTMITTVYYSSLVLIVLTASFSCYYKIFQIIKRIKTQDQQQMSFYSASKVLQSYKSTSLVLVYFVVILITSIAYIFILVFIRQYNLGVTELRISLEIVNMLNCSIDPFLYVLWFKETRMELLKMLTHFSNKRLIDKVETMRTEIYDIVTIDISNHSARVHPAQNKCCS